MFSQYQCFMIGSRGELLARREVEAANDDDARKIARMLDAANKTVQGVEVWIGGRRVGMVRFDHDDAASEGR